MSFKSGDRVRCLCNSTRESDLTVGEEYVVAVKLPWDDIFAFEGKPDVFFHGSRFVLVQAAEPVHYLVMVRTGFDDMPVKLFDDWDTAIAEAQSARSNSHEGVIAALGWPIATHAERIGVITLRGGVPVSWQEVKEFDSDEVPEGGDEQDADSGHVCGGSGGCDTDGCSGVSVRPSGGCSSVL